MTHQELSELEIIINRAFKVFLVLTFLVICFNLFRYFYSVEMSSKNKKSVSVYYLK